MGSDPPREAGRPRLGERRATKIDRSRDDYLFTAEEPNSALQGAARDQAGPMATALDAFAPLPRPIAQDRPGERHPLRPRQLCTAHACAWLPEPALSTVLVLSQTAPVLLIANFTLHAVMIFYGVEYLNARVLCFAGRDTDMHDFAHELLLKQVAQHTIQSAHRGTCYLWIPLSHIQHVHISLALLLLLCRRPRWQRRQLREFHETVCHSPAGCVVATLALWVHAEVRTLRPRLLHVLAVLTASLFLVARREPTELASSAVQAVQAVVLCDEAHQHCVFGINESVRLRSIQLVLCKSAVRLDSASIMLHFLPVNAEVLGEGVPCAPELGGASPFISASARSIRDRSYASRCMWSHARSLVLLYASTTKPSAIFSRKSRCGMCLIGLPASTFAAAAAATAASLPSSFIFFFFAASTAVLAALSSRVQRRNPLLFSQAAVIAPVRVV